MPRDAFERLLANLRKTRQTYARLLELGEAKQRHILCNDVEKLGELLRREESLVADGARLNEERGELHRLCRRRLAGSPSAETLSELCRHLPPYWRERFGAERDRLLETQRRLQQVNRTNVMLVNNSLALLQGLLAALFDVEPVSAYGPRGGRRRAELRTRSLDASI